jgi:hypothetical protein
VTSPSLSVDTERGRMYRITPDGDPVYPSITNIAGQRAKDFLGPWHARLAGERAVEMYSWLDRNPDRALAEISRISRDPRGTQRKIAAAAEESGRRAADFGTLVHAACEQWERTGTRPDQDWIVAAIAEARERGAFARDRGPEQLLREAAVRLDGFDAFLNDFQPEFVEIEQTVVNHSVGYAGTTDALCRVGGSMLCADIKTSKKVRGDYSLQAVAIMHAEALLDDDGTEREVPDLTGAFIIHLPAAGGYAAVPLHTGAAQWDAFLALRRIWDFDEDGCTMPAAATPKQMLLDLLRSRSDLIG